MFQFYPGERVVVFIDGVSLYSAARSLDFDIDYRRLLHKLRAECHLVRAYYYTTLQEDQDYSPLRPLVDWLAYNGYAMVTKPAKEFTDATGRRRFRGDMDVEVAVDMMEATAFAQHIVLFSGDGDFRRAVEAIQNRGVRVTVV
ncbi:MAG: NYN domain-containing protein, partial [Alphaproteobacteria bacterium]